MTDTIMARLDRIDRALARMQEIVERMGGGASPAEFDPPHIRACKALAKMWGMSPATQLVWKPKPGTVWTPKGYEAVPHQEIPAWALMAPAVVAVLRNVRSEGGYDGAGSPSDEEAFNRTIDRLVETLEGNGR